MCRVSGFAKFIMSMLCDNENFDLQGLKSNNSFFHQKINIFK